MKSFHINCPVYLLNLTVKHGAIAGSELKTLAPMFPSFNEVNGSKVFRKLLLPQNTIYWIIRFSLGYNKSQTGWFSSLNHEILLVYL